jgi:starch phosphorylase
MDASGQKPKRTRPEENGTTGVEVAEIKRDLLGNLFHILGKSPEVATRNDWYLAVAQSEIAL